MKKIILQTCLLLFVGAKLFAQQYDDGYVTKVLGINVINEKFDSYVKGFDQGFQNESNGLINSNEDVIRYYGIDLLGYPRLRDVVNSSDYTVYNNHFSPAFLTSLQNVFDKVGTDYVDIISIRTALRNLPTLTTVSGTEAEALAAIDITIQDLNKKVVLTTSDVGMNSGLGIQFASYNSTNAGILSWFRCALGVAGNAILGGFTGAGSGAFIGGAAGAVVGGILGIGSGGIIGARKYCS